jgi:outer membrane protein assembly factor BamA
VGFAQQKALHVLAKNTKNQAVLSSVKFSKNHKNKKLLKLERNNILKKLAEKGYLKSKIDSSYLKDSIYTVIYDIGRPIKQISIGYSQTIKESLLKKYTSDYTKQTITLKWDLVKPFLNNLLEYYQKNGNPFTRIRLKNIHLKKNEAFATLEITKNSQRYIDSIIVKGYSKFPTPFINNYLDLNPHTLFNTTKLKTISTRLKALSFVDEIKSPEILFTKSKTKIYLYLKKKNANTFDGLIGFASKENGSGLIFNGYLDINLKNALNTGETIALLFKSNGEDKQKFNLKAELPYAFKSKITPSFDFNIYKQDTSFINIGVNLGVKYPINYNSNLGVLLNVETSSNLLSQQNTSVKTYNSFYYGLTYNLTSYSNSVFFDDKFKITVSVLNGSKTILDTKENQFKLNLTASYLWALTPKSAIFVKNQSSYLDANNYVQNELYRIGGFNSIRGFDEESIFASNYSIINLEYRYRTSEKEYLYSVTDFANYTNPILNNNSNLYSLGLGYQFLSKIGIVNLSYVFGKTTNQDFSFSNAKLHFSIKTMF